MNLERFLLWIIALIIVFLIIWVLLSVIPSR